MSFIKRFLIFFLILKFVFSIDCSWEFVYNKSDPKFKTKQHLQELNSISNAFVQLCDARVGDKYILRTKMLCFDNIFTSILKDAIASYDYLYTFEKCYASCTLFQEFSQTYMHTKIGYRYLGERYSTKCLHSEKILHFQCGLTGSQINGVRIKFDDIGGLCENDCSKEEFIHFMMERHNLNVTNALLDFKMFPNNKLFCFDELTGRKDFMNCRDGEYYAGFRNIKIVKAKYVSCRDYCAWNTLNFEWPIQSSFKRNFIVGDERSVISCMAHHININCFRSKVNLYYNWSAFFAEKVFSLCECFYIFLIFIYNDDNNNIDIMMIITKLFVQHILRWTF